MKQILSNNKSKTSLTSWSKCKICNIEKDLNGYYLIDKKTNRRHTVCKHCVGEKEKAVRNNDTIKIKDLTLCKELIDYSKIKTCKKCGIQKEAEQFPKNGDRRKNKCKKCYSQEHAEKHVTKWYEDIIEDFNCRTCDTLVKVKDAYIENKRTNKTVTQCRDCYFADVNNRKAKRRVKVKDSRQMNTPEEETRIKEIYRQCKKMSQNSSVNYEVDHIKPLSKGGAHHPDNLQILTQEENRKKADKYETTN